MLGNFIPKPLAHPRKSCQLRNNIVFIKRRMISSTLRLNCAEHLFGISFEIPSHPAVTSQLLPHWRDSRR